MVRIFKTVNILITLFLSVSSFAQSGLINTLTVKQLAAGSNHSLVLLSDGTLWAWGDNTGGSLGDGSYTHSDNPIRVGNENDWKVITAGLSSSHAIKADGTLWGWGNNKIGQLGISTENFKYSIQKPTQVGKDKDWQMVSSGKNFTIGLKTDGSIWVWGATVYNLISREMGVYEPIKITDKNNTDWMQIAAGNDFFMALRKDGTIWTLGQTNVGNKSFVKINNDTDWASIDAGRRHAMAIKKDGTLWGWGDNSKGQLGNGTKESSDIPVKVEGEFTNVAASENFTVAMKKNGGEVYWWGKSWMAREVQIKPTYTMSFSSFPLLASGPENYLILTEEKGILEYLKPDEFGKFRLREVK